MKMDIYEKGKSIGEDFLVWLWKMSLSEFSLMDDRGKSIQIFLDDLIVLSNEQGDVKEIVLRKGNPSECREGFEALARGMKPIKAKIRIIYGEMEWIFVFNPAEFQISSMKLPVSQASDPNSKLLDRMFLIEECFNHMELKYSEYLLERIENPEQYSEMINKWISESIALV